MSERPRVRTSVTLITTLAIAGGAWQAIGQTQGESQTQPEQGQRMQCPMMSAMKGLEFHAESPTVLLAMAEQLQLTQAQKQRLESLADDVRTQAKKVLTDEQQQQLQQAPEGSLSMMQVMMLLRQGQADESGQMCPMCMKMMRERMQGQQTQGKAERAEQHPDDEDG